MAMLTETNTSVSLHEYQSSIFQVSIEYNLGINWKLDATAIALGLLVYGIQNTLKFLGSKVSCDGGFPIYCILSQIEAHVNQVND
jgi:hypothetical protein